MISAVDISLKAVREIVADVRDPEIPILTIDDLGVLRDVSFDHEQIVVVITPTYSGCPAMQTIADDIRIALEQAGLGKAIIKMQLAPAWTTAWLSPAGRAKLSAVGIAPPVEASTNKNAIRPAASIGCPQCGSLRTECISEFGSTACKALYRCTECLEPFDYFKCI